MCRAEGRERDACGGLGVSSAACTLYALFERLLWLRPGATHDIPVLLIRAASAARLRAKRSSSAKRRLRGRDEGEPTRNADVV
jgi:hypothetical protein